MRSKPGRFFLNSLLLGIAVAIAGHYYIIQYPQSKDSIVFAYILGLSVMIFSFLFQLRSYATRLREDRSLEKIAAEIQQAPSYYEHDFYFNRLKKGFELFFFTLLLAGAIYFIWAGRYIMAGILIVPFSFIFPTALKEFNDRTPQLRIAENGIWLKDFGFTPWEKIQKIYIRKDRSGRSEVARLEILLLNSESKAAVSFAEINDLKQWRSIGTILQTMGKTEVESDYSL
jgi:hypothetical protein